MGTTPRGWPYPELGDPANVPTDMANLANAIDNAIFAQRVAGPAPLSPGYTTIVVTFPTGRFTSPPVVTATMSTGGSGNTLPVTTFMNQSGVTASSVSVRLYNLAQNNDVGGSWVNVIAIPTSR